MSVPVIVTPVLSSLEGQCLTPLNCLEVGGFCGAYYLDALLVKPGLDVLKSLSSLAHYVGWQGELLLNASTININEKGQFSIHSGFDGSRVQYVYRELLPLFTALKPDYLLLPPDLMQFDPQVLDKIPKETKIVTSCANASTFYADGVLLQGNEVQLWVSNQPADDAYRGIVYSDKKLNLSDACYATDFLLISEGCKCPTCQQGFTRAYLHHLYKNTPLLCQRYLIQHNLETCLNYFGHVP